MHATEGAVMNEPVKKPNTYTCSRCGKTYEKGWSDEEAMADSKDQFGEHEDYDVVCDPCYQKFMAWYQGGGREKVTS